MTTQTITTAAELAALPEGSVIRDCVGDVGVLMRGKVHYPDTTPMLRGWAERWLPATVLCRPDTEPAPTPAETAEAIAQAIEAEAESYVGERAAYWAGVYARIAREWAGGAL